jgi:uncharacterized membrane protein
MITVVGIVFSITIVALTMASAQFGHRLIVNFMRDTWNQVVLGTFVATFLYCLLVLLVVSNGASGGFVPSISSAMSVALGAGGRRRPDLLYPPRSRNYSGHERYC